MAGPLIAVWSPKGGVGKTLIAAGLAMHLVRRCPGSTMLIDLDAGKADIAPLLQVSLHPSIFDYPGGTDRTVVHPSGLMVLPGPSRLVDGGLVSAELADAALNRARSEGLTVVADLDTDLRDSTVVTLERADAALLVVTPDLLSLYGARRFKQEAGLIGLDLSKFRLVINRVSVRQAIPDQEIIDLVGLKPAGRIPSLPGLASAVNHGMSSATFRSNTEFTAALQLLADSLAFAGVPAVAPARRRDDPRPAGVIPALRRWWRNL